MGFIAKNTVLALCALGVLAACSSDKEKKVSLGSLAMGMAKAKFGKKAKVETADAATKTPQRPSRAALEAVGRPVLYVTIPRTGSSQPAVLVATNGAYKTYFSADKSSVTLQDGIVTATRGQLEDLFAQELSLTPAQIFYSGPFPKTYTRSQRHLDGEGKLITKTYTCAIAPDPADETLTVFERTVQVRKFTELCQNKTRAFQNNYWVDLRAHRIWQSHQSISKTIGHMIVQLVVP